jgi:hypothetical protein
MAVSAIMALGVVISCSHVWGEPARDKDYPKRPVADSAAGARSTDREFSDELAASKFADTPRLTYQTKDGDTLFAEQLKFDLGEGSVRPRDYLIAVDTTASQGTEGGVWLATAKLLAGKLIASCSPEDRVALWTINTEKCTQDLTRGFVEPAQAAEGLQKLLKEYPSGAADLVKGLNKALATFQDKPDRQQVIVYLGDGVSVLGTPSDRTQLCADMVKREISFYPVPLGPRLDPQNLHALTSGTGGLPIRITPGEDLDAVAKRLHNALSVPVLYPQEVKLGDTVTEYFPTKLPPLRPDSPTLLVGQIKPGSKLEVTVTGTVLGQKVTKKLSTDLPESEADNFFLCGMIQQWRSDKTVPALLKADRVLAYAYEQHQFARAELNALAEDALDHDQFDAAVRLYQQALQFDPHDQDAAVGLDMAKGLQEHKFTKKELLEKLQPKNDDVVTEIRGKDKTKLRVTREQLALLQQDKEPIAAPPGAKQPPPDLLDEARKRQAINDERIKEETSEAIRQAERDLRNDPAGTIEKLRKTREDIRLNPNLSEPMRQQLLARVGGALGTFEPVAREQVRLRAQQERVLAQAAARDARAAVEQDMENRIKSRMLRFHDYMNQGREDLAYEQAQAIRADLVSQGAPIPPAVTAAYIIGLNGTNLRQIRELERIRQERYLLAMMSVERSAVPFPDEPPVEFPKYIGIGKLAKTWKEITDIRKARYESTSFGLDTPRKTLEMRDTLNKVVSKYDGITDPKIRLSDVLDDLSLRMDVTFDVNEAAFREQDGGGVPDVMSTPIAEKPFPTMREVTWATVLRKVLSRIPALSGATYIIRRDVIEITTNKFAAAEKVIRVYPVADLVIPIPNSFNASSVIQQTTILGFAGSFGNQGGFNLGGFGGLAGIGGGLAGIGGFGGGLAGLGGGLAGLGGGLAGLGGGLAGLGGFGGGLGGFGGGLGGFGGGFGGALGIGGGLGGLQGGFGGAGGGIGGQLGFAGGGVNRGVGGGFAGFGGGQLGQLGNLGGQFGFQGGDQSLILITLIRQVVGTPRDWAPLQYYNQQGLPREPGVDNPDEQLNDPFGNQLGFYPPSMALVVKGSSTVNTRINSRPIVPNADRPPVALNDKDREGQLAQGKIPDPAPGRVRVGGDRDGDKLVKNDEKDPKKDEQTPLAELDPKVIWQDALDKGVNNPGLIVAVADYLAINGKFDHAAEFLKANLRQGIVVKPWVYKALAEALRETKAPPEEIERAELAAADLEPMDAQGFINASQAMANLEHYDHALAFCQRAAALQPNVSEPYSDALSVAERGRDVEGMKWAAQQLLSRDWVTSNQDLHGQAKEKLLAMAKALDHDNRRVEAGQIRSLAEQTQERDLVIKLSWQERAGLDLRVKDPSGSVCTPLCRQTVGGGVMVGGNLTETNTESCVFAQAFSGDYEITVDRVWGKTLGDKAQILIIQHQGTPREVTRVVTVDFKAQSTTVKLTLDDGKRTALAQVPTTPPTRPLTDPKSPNETTMRVLNKLRNMAEPDWLGDGPGVRAGTPVADVDRMLDDARKGSPAERVAFQNRVAPYVSNTVDVTAQASITPDRRFVRLSLTPAFNTVNKINGVPTVVNPLLPSGPNPGP